MSKVPEISFFLEPDEKHFHAWLHNQPNNFFAFKQNKSEEEIAKLAEWRAIFERRVQRFSTIDASFVDADLTQAFSKWMRSLSLKVPPCAELEGLRTYFETYVKSMRDDTNELYRDAKAKELCEQYRKKADENLFEAWMLEQPKLYVRAIAHTDHNMKIELKKKFLDLCACKWDVPTGRDFILYMLNNDEGPAGLDNSAMARTAMKLVYAEMPMAWRWLKSRDLETITVQAEKLPFNDKTTMQMIEHLNNCDVESEDESEDEFEADLEADLEAMLAAVPAAVPEAVPEAVPAAVPDAVPEEAVPAAVPEEAVPAAVPDAVPAAVPEEAVPEAVPEEAVPEAVPVPAVPVPAEAEPAAKRQQEMADPLAAAAWGYDPSVVVPLAPAPPARMFGSRSLVPAAVPAAVPEEVEPMGSLPCVTSLEQQRKLMTAKLKKLDEDIALKNADNVDADMEPVFRGLCKRQRVSFQRGTWSVPVRKLRKLNKSDKAQAFTREVLDLIKYTRQEEQKAIVARAEAREKLRRLVDGYYGKITAEFPAKL
jgi:hypothetical protein